MATQFITYYKDTLQFQSTLAYLKDPPSSYQQPAVDLLGGLDALQFRVNSNAFDNEYDFEVALQKLIFAAHDSHLYLFGGLTEIFSFGMIYPLISVSIDGIALPKVYLEGESSADVEQFEVGSDNSVSDDLNSAQEANGQWNASAIATIDGQDVTDFLTQFAASNSLGYSNPDADWNNLMDSPAQDIQYLNNALDGSSPFYPGDVFSIIFENGSTIASTNWIAVLNNDDFDLSINSSQDFYENFVVSDLDDFVGEFSKKRRRDAIIASPRKALTRSSNYKRQTAPDTQNSWNNSAYPSNPVAAEPDLGGEGVLSGYFLNESLTAVLSIPNFNPGNITTFSNTVGQFLRLSKAAGMQKIVVDVQQNYGGDTLLATDTFKQVRSGVTVRWVPLICSSSFPQSIHSLAVESVHSCTLIRLEIRIQPRTTLMRKVGTIPSLTLYSAISGLLPNTSTQLVVRTSRPGLSTSGRTQIEETSSLQR